MSGESNVRIIRKRDQRGLRLGPTVRIMQRQDILDQRTEWGLEA